MPDADSQPTVDGESIPSSVAKDEAESTERQEQAHVGVSITAKVKRGTDTRDQDELVIKGKGADAKEATVNFEASLQAAESHQWSERLRAIQPEEDPEDG